MSNPMQPHYKRKKPTTVQLTSLLDLLFVMVFVSLLQQKTPVPDTKPQPMPKKIVKKVIKKKPTTVKKSVSDIEATFHFYATSRNPKIPNGKYLMRGVYNSKTRELKLGGISWIDRPQHYDMVPLSGKIGPSNRTFTGRIEFPSCKQFTLERVSSRGHSAIGGKWKGTYECGQGPTGLTLTIL